jgi:hypothetical protein
MRVRNGQVWQSFSYPLAQGFAEQHDVFSNVCGFSDATFNVGPPDAVETTSGASVAQCYETFGLRAAVGAVAIVTSLLPALRAASVEPFATLRQD